MVARIVRDDEVPGSNPGAPTYHFTAEGTHPGFSFGSVEWLACGAIGPCSLFWEVREERRRIQHSRADIGNQESAAHRSDVQYCLGGAGRLGTAVATSDIFKEHGFRIVCIFDSDPEKIGRLVDGVRVLPVAEATEVCRENGVVLGVIAVPPGEAQEAADILVRGGAPYAPCRSCRFPPVVANPRCRSLGIRFPRVWSPRER